MPVTQSPQNHPTYALEAEFGSSVRALYVFDRRGKPDLIGSGVLAQLGSRLFLLTATHVLNECGDQPLWIAGDEEFVAVDSKLFRPSMLPGLEQKPDRLDVGFLELSGSIGSSLGFIQPVRIHQIDTAEECLSETQYVGMGFPIKRAELRKQARVAEASLARASGRGRPEALVTLQLSALTHIAFAYDRKRTVVNGVLQPAIKPHGMSGGGLWRLDRPAIGESTSRSGHLVAILTEFHEFDIKAMIGTRITILLDSIRKEYIDVDAALPREQKYTLHS